MVKKHIEENELRECRGSGEYGQLGVGDMKDKDLPQQVFLEPRNQVTTSPGTSIVDISLVHLLK